jgi:ArsR family transcriptional regulator
MLDSMRRFKASLLRSLAHPTRVGIVEYLQYGDLTAERLCEKLGCEEAALVPHLKALEQKAIIIARKDGERTVYSVRDPSFGRVLEALREYYLSHLSEALQILREEQASERADVERSAEGQERT